MLFGSGFETRHAHTSYPTADSTVFNPPPPHAGRPTLLQIWTLKRSPSQPTSPPSLLPIPTSSHPQPPPTAPPPISLPPPPPVLWRAVPAPARRQEPARCSCPMTCPTESCTWIWPWTCGGWTPRCCRWCHSCAGEFVPGQGELWACHVELHALNAHACAPITQPPINQPIQSLQCADPDGHCQPLLCGPDPSSS